MQRLRRLSRTIYRLTAPHYESAIRPVMLPLARDLVAQSSLPSAGDLLDIGTGTGFALRAAAGANRRCIGIDLSFSMLRVAAVLRRQAGWPATHLVLANAHDLSIFPVATFEVALASFSLSECDPERVLRSVRRVLRPGGMLHLQEWGPYATADPRAALDDTLAAFILPEAQGLHADLRALLAAPLPWQLRLQDAEDYHHALKDAGLTPLECREFQPVTLRLSVPAFLTYTLAWAPRALEIAALPLAVRAAFVQAATERLLALADPDGVLTFSPSIIRARAARF